MFTTYLIVQIFAERHNMTIKGNVPWFGVADLSRRWQALCVDKVPVYYIIDHGNHATLAYWDDYDTEYAVFDLEANTELVKSHVSDALSYGPHAASWQM